MRVLPRVRVSGIIPARAGFTRAGAAPRGMARDHPRSRGVYLRPPAAGCGAEGSSPLARGLPEVMPSSRCRTGIIPARAGFTACGRAAGASRTDHPRSRGVYGPGARRRRTAAGSSPLARGLRHRRHTMSTIARIIPARAGFTHCECLLEGALMDHPRSRGVYFRALCVRSFRVGSSPLARGLLEDLDESGPEAGIIPARAGFTGTCWAL